MSGGTKRKHHYVSQWLLRNFAVDGHFVVTPLNGSDSHRGTPRGLGWIRDSHRADPLSPNPDLFEDEHSVLEGDAAVVASRIISGILTAVDPESQGVLERFLTLHLMRHPVMMAHVHAGTATAFAGYETLPNLDALRRALLAQAVSYAAALNGDETNAGTAAVHPERWEKYRAAFAPYTWNILRYDRPSLVLGDVLVCTSQLHPKRQFDERLYGMGAVGIGEAERITIALSPTVGLLLSRDNRVSRLRAEAFNRSTIGCATDWIVHPENWASASPDLHAHAHEMIERRAGIYNSRGHSRSSPHQTDPLRPLTSDHVTGSPHQW